MQGGRRQTAQRMAVFSVIFIIVAMALSWTESAFGREATAKEAAVFHAAARHMTAIGIPTTVPKIYVYPSFIGCGAVGIPACAWWPERAISISPKLAKDAEKFGNVVAMKTRAARARKLDACYLECAQMMHVAVHELIHIHRIQTANIPGRERKWSDAFEEGLADQVASDIQYAFEWRVARWTGRIYEVDFIGYVEEASHVRRISVQATGKTAGSYEARKWRINQVAL